MPPSTPVPASERYDRDEFFSTLPPGGQGVLDEDIFTTGVRTVADARLDVELLPRDTIQNLGALEEDDDAFQGVTGEIRAMTRSALAPGKLPQMDDLENTGAFVAALLYDLDDLNETTQVGVPFQTIGDEPPRGIQDINLVRPDLEDVD